MATFYILPPRPALEEILHAIARQLLPGAPLPRNLWDAFRESLSVDGPSDPRSAKNPPEACYLITQDELPEDEPWEVALPQHFGAEPEDRVIESSLPRLASMPSPRASFVLNTPFLFPSLGTRSTIPSLLRLAGDIR